MATVNFTACGKLAASGNDKAQVPLYAVGDSYDISVDGTNKKAEVAVNIPNGSSAAFIRVVSDVAIRYKIGTSSVDVTSGVAIYLPAGTVEHIPNTGFTHIAVKTA